MLRWAVPLLAVVIAGIVGAVVLTRSGSDGEGTPPSSTTTTEPAPVEVSSDAPVYGTLAELAGAADAVVRGHVTGTEPGRSFGGGADGTSIRSRLVSLQVDEVLRGDGVAAGETLLVEEEGWTDDGAPLIVDGAVPTQDGDEGIWFLVDTGDATTGSWITVNAQGRYLVDADGRLHGAEGDDPLVSELSAETLDELAAQISRTPPGP